MTPPCARLAGSAMHSAHSARSHLPLRPQHVLQPHNLDGHPQLLAKVEQGAQLGSPAALSGERVGSVCECVCGKASRNRELKRREGRAGLARSREALWAALQGAAHDCRRAQGALPAPCSAAYAACPPHADDRAKGGAAASVHICANRTGARAEGGAAGGCASTIGCWQLASGCGPDAGC